MAGSNAADKGTDRRRTAKAVAARETRAILDRITRRVRSQIEWRKLLVPVITVALVAVALSFTAMLIPGRDGSEQSGEIGPAAAVSDLYDSSYVLSTVEPTNKWVNFYGLESTFGRLPLPTGAVISAYDPQGVVCGRFSVTQPGRYGLMPVYGDDPLTEVDEGAVPGDLLEFRVNGIRAKVKGPDTPVWTAMGDLKLVDLTVQWGMINRPIRTPR